MMNAFLFDPASTSSNASVVAYLPGINASHDVEWVNTQRPAWTGNRYMPQAYIDRDTHAQYNRFNR